MLAFVGFNAAAMVILVHGHPRISFCHTSCREQEMEKLA